MRLIILILTIGVGWSVGSIVGMDRAIKNMKELQDYKYKPSYWAIKPATPIELTIDKSDIKDCVLQKKIDGLILQKQGDSCSISYSATSTVNGTTTATINVNN